MKSSVGPLRLVLVIILGMMFAGSASATLSSEGEWAWTIPTNNFALTLQTTSGDKSTSLYLTNGQNLSDPKNSMFLLKNESVSWSTIYFSNNTASLNPLSPSTGIALTNNKFYFAFSTDNGLSFDTSYKWEKIVDGTYVISSDNGKLPVALGAATVAPSAVPIPGAALLLGSGLMGLIGIGSRKKKA